MAIPTVKEWTTAKTKYGAPDTAGGVTVSKAFAAYWASGANTPKKYLVAYTALEKALATYIGKIDKKKIKQYDAFEKEFLNGFIGKVHKERVDTERGMANLNTYKSEIVKEKGAGRRPGTFQARAGARSDGHGQPGHRPDDRAGQGVGGYQPGAQESRLLGRPYGRPPNSDAIKRLGRRHHQKCRCHCQAGESRRHRLTGCSRSDSRCLGRAAAVFLWRVSDVGRAIVPERRR